MLIKKLIILIILCEFFNFESAKELKEVNLSRFVRSISDHNTVHNCGKRIVGRGTIFGGKNVTRGSYPW